MPTNATTSPTDRKRLFLIGAAAAIALLGMFLHNAREFGIASVATSRNGEIPFGALLLVLVLFWWRFPGSRFFAASTMLGIALLNLVAGAVITVIPFHFLPFQPEQSVEHFLSHIVYGLAQIPLIVLSLREAMVYRRLQVSSAAD